MGPTPKSPVANRVWCVRREVTLEVPVCGDDVAPAQWMLLAASRSTACVGAPIRNVWLGNLGRADHFSGLGLTIGSCGVNTGLCQGFGTKLQITLGSGGECLSFPVAQEDRAPQFIEETEREASWPVLVREMLFSGLCGFTSLRPGWGSCGGFHVTLPDDPPSPTCQ